jgi:hypothetical protein
MSIATAPLHTPAELALVGADDRTDIVVFQAPSASDATRVNTVALDTRTGEILCDCKGAEFGRVCWHADYVVAAWQRTTAIIAARSLTPEGLLAMGRKAAHMVGVYRQRCGRALPDDVLTLVAARSEWRRRAALAAEQRAAREVAAARREVAEWESLSHSDRHIDLHVDGRKGERAYQTARATLAALDLPLAA